MAGTKAGGVKIRETLIKNHGENFFKEIGRKGGSVSRPSTRYFAVNRNAASKAGEKGGRISKRGKAKN